MSWSKDQGERDEPRAYHHGNLREALIRAALELIAKKGPAGFTFAEAARFAGVSPARRMSMAAEGRSGTVKGLVVTTCLLKEARGARRAAIRSLTWRGD
jgi:hypothetical protein